jgi:predicted RNA-binding protein associated with RNAse of E/G family
MGSGYRAVWFLFNGEPYDVGRFYRPDGTWTGYYVDILEPVRWQGADPETLEPLVDLFLDVWIAPGGSFQLFDEDELGEALEQDAVTEDQARRARRTADQVIGAIERGAFPPEVVRRFSG